MKIKVNKHKLNIHYRGSPWGNRTQQHTCSLRYAHSHHVESHLGKKQPQAKIAIAFLFGQLHFNNATSHALFYGGHLVMRSKRCAVQNQGITLSSFYGRFFVEGQLSTPHCPSTCATTFIYLLTPPRFGALNRESESSGSQPVYRKLFPRGPHSSKNNSFEIKISRPTPLGSLSVLLWLLVGASSRKIRCLI